MAPPISEQTSPAARRQSYVSNIKPYDYNSLEIDSINGQLYTANGYTYQLTQSYGGRFSYCKIAVFGSAVKNRVLPTRPTFLATKPQVTQVQRAVCSEVRSFSPHFRNPSPRKAVPSRFFRKLIEAASAPPCSSPPPSCSARPSPPASTCPGTSSCPIRAPRCTSASPSPASGPSCRPGRSLRLSSSA